MVRLAHRSAEILKFLTPCSFFVTNLLSKIYGVHKKDSHNK